MLKKTLSVAATCLLITLAVLPLAAETAAHRYCYKNDTKKAQTIESLELYDKNPPKGKFKRHLVISSQVPSQAITVEPGKTKYFETKFKVKSHKIRFSSDALAFMLGGTYGMAGVAVLAADGTPVVTVNHEPGVDLELLEAGVELFASDGYLAGLDTVEVRTEDGEPYTGLVVLEELFSSMWVGSELGSAFTDLEGRPEAGPAPDLP